MASDSTETGTTVNVKGTIKSTPIALRISAVVSDVDVTCDNPALRVVTSLFKSQGPAEGGGYAIYDYVLLRRGEKVQPLDFLSTA